MLTFDSWHREGLSFDELPTMRDVLLASDPALVADELHRRRVRASLSSGERPPSLARVVVFEPSAEDGVPTAPEGEHDFADRMYDIGDALAKALRRDFHRDCVDLAERLGRS